MPESPRAAIPDLAVAASEDILQKTVDDIVERHGAHLPDLADVVVLLPDTALSRRFHACLLQRLPAESAAVLAPWCGTLPQWANMHVPLADDALTIISPQARRLMLIDEIRKHPALFRDGNTWQVTDALLALFDELVLNDTNALDAGLEEWRGTVRDAYACTDTLPQLDREAFIVHTLWRAWREQLEAGQMIDATGAYASRLVNAHRQPDENAFFYAVNPGNGHRLENAFIDWLVAQGRCRRVRFDMTRPGQDAEQAIEHRRRFLQACFAHDGSPLLQRAAAFKSESTPAALQLSMFLCGDSEQEARAVETQVRRWLLEGRSSIGIISEDRKLSRRVRALLERADVQLRDLAGWSLATTSAASVIERWLECIEEDFDYHPMLDVLKSPFFDAGRDRDSLLLGVYRLEHDIIRNEKIGHGIARYRAALKSRAHRLQHWPQQSYEQVADLLARLEKAAHYLAQVQRSQYPVPAADILAYLGDSLEQLGIAGGLGEDDAGSQILDALDEMRVALDVAAPRLLWRDFRTWLGTTLEDKLFNPGRKESPVSLMSLQQADGHRFDALVVAAADRQHLPGRPAASPFFNQQVRSRLQLPDWRQQKQFRLACFQRVLLGASTALITCKNEENGEPVPLSPWVEALDVFYGLTQPGSMADAALQQLMACDTGVRICDTETLPDRPPRPAPAMPPGLVPARISASAHQRLVDCPYRFFAGDALRLKAPDEVVEELQKSDYGQRIHSILQAFHAPVKGMPPPFGEAITAANRERAVEHLENLSRAVFTRDLENNSLHRSWLYRWLQRVPEYIEWQIGQQGWTVSRTEDVREAPLAGDIRLYGRLDRVDVQDGRERIIDYKTGGAPSQADIDSGEDVQLVTYALLDPDATSVAYLQLDTSNSKVGTRSKLEDDALEDLRAAARDRLVEMIEMQRKGKPMPAWGDSKTCSYCDFGGLCRRKVWETGRSRVPGPAVKQPPGYLTAYKAPSTLEK